MSLKANKIPRLAITLGEPAGIGPELVVKIAQLSFSAELTVIGDAEVLIATAKQLGLPLALTAQTWQDNYSVHTPGHLKLIEVKCPVKPIAGELNSQNAAATLRTLTLASELGLQGQVDAIVTAPVHKAVLNQVDRAFLGHTEFFAQHAQVEKVVMMLATNQLRVTLATTHIPLSQVPSHITRESLTESLEVICTAFEGFGIDKVRIAVCGLNPHAGEDGLLGNEDIEVITPVIKDFQSKGKSVFGPFPADTLFTPSKRAAFDVFLAMYHDQGLPVIKASGFGECANITLGLPYIRTSVDHGTALDIAAKYQANADSLAYAINYAIELYSGKLPS
ncbi:4-hydroxythreonine-4-phosphate dehydrogenase PdxA [Aliikangiella sp. IMCC44632]